jgi:hypothetical protein
MNNISDESKLIIASNLTVATLLRDIYTHQTGEKPLKGTDDYVLDKFRSILDYLAAENKEQ